MTDRPNTSADDGICEISRSDAWPCPACGATCLADGVAKCLDETGHGMCEHTTYSPCTNDDLFEEIELG